MIFNPIKRVENVQKVVQAIYHHLGRIQNFNQFEFRFYLEFLQFEVHFVENLPKIRPTKIWVQIRQIKNKNIDTAYFHRLFLKGNRNSDFFRFFFNFFIILAEKILNFIEKSQTNQNLSTEKRFRNKEDNLSP